MQVIILAGGKGSRIAHLLNFVPKPMYETYQGPFLKVLLDQLIDQGATLVILAVGHKFEVIESFFGKVYRDVPLIYSIETDPLGTGGALKQAIKYVSSPSVLVLNGDSYSKVAYRELINAHHARDVAITIALRESEESDRYGSVKLDESGFVIDFKEKKSETARQLNYLNCGVYLFKTQIFEKYCTSSSSFSLEEDFIPAATLDYQVFGLNCVSEFIDIGTPASLAETNNFLTKVLKK